jgi:hypothetical protein
MKVKNWKRKIAATLIAAGMWAPGAAHALDIPLGDPSFEAYNLSPTPAGSAYAYANVYRPTSAWIGNPDDAAGPVDGGFNASNWIYHDNYAELATKRGAPRTGDQDMHGRGHYSGQESSAVFEAGKTYIFSIYSQGDHNSAVIGVAPNGPGWDSRVWLYLYNGAVPFREANSLTSGRYSPAGDWYNRNDFVNRDPSWTQEQSRAGWQQISLSWTVQPGAPEIGNPVGVAFWAGPDACLDDASLRVVPEPGSVVLVSAAGLSLLAWRRRTS